MDESASAPTDGPHRGLGGGLLHLAMRPKTHGAVQAGGGGRGETIVGRGESNVSNQQNDDIDIDNDNDKAPLSVVTRRRNGQQVRHLMLPPSHYAPVAPPIAMFATGGQDAGTTPANNHVDENNYDDDDDDDDARIDQEIVALRSLARARSSTRTHRIARRPQHHVRGSSGGGGGGSGSTARDRVSLSFLLPPAVSASPSSLLLNPSDRAMAMRARAFPALERSPPPVAAAVFPNNRTLAGRVGKLDIGGRFRRPVLMRQHRPPAVAATTVVASASRSGAGAVTYIRRPPRNSASAPVTVEPMLVLATILALPGFDFAFRDWSLGAAAAAAAAAGGAADFNKAAAANADIALMLIASKLALAVLSHPAVVRRCGRSPHRRGVARFLVYLLTFPFVTPHGKAAFETACGGYTPGDETRPAFWAQYAVGFATWLGLIDSNGGGGSSSSSSSDPFLGGTVLQVLVICLCEARLRFLGSKVNDAGAESTPETTEDKDMGEVMGVDADAGSDGTTVVSAAAAAATSTTSDLSAQVAKLQQDRRNAQNLPVSKAVDAWLMFVARRHDEDIDPALLAELSLD